MHQILETILVTLLVVLTILVNFHNGSIYHKSPVISQGLQTLLVLSVTELWVKILVQSRLLILVLLISLE